MVGLIVFCGAFIYKIIIKNDINCHEKPSKYDLANLETANTFIKVTRPLVFLLLFSTFIPKSKTIAAMYLVPKIIENKQVSELPEKMVKLLNVKMDDWINDLAGEKK